MPADFPLMAGFQHAITVEQSAAAALGAAGT